MKNQSATSLEDNSTTRLKLTFSLLLHTIVNPTRGIKPDSLLIKN